MGNANKKFFLIGLTAWWLVFVLWVGISSAITAEDKYYRAEACYKTLRNSSKKQKYRHNWLLCIDKFQAVYRHDPSGPWSAAGLYMSGKLYQELYKRSQKPSDLKEAIDIFERIANRFPKSRYKQRATAAIRSISTPDRTKRAPQETIVKKKKLPTSKPNAAKDKYIKAEACYRKLVNNAGKQKYRNNWQLCIDKFQAVYRHDPSGPWAAAGLYMSGKLYQELYKHSYKGADQTEALEIFKHVVKDYPNSAYSPRAADALGRISSKSTLPVASKKATGKKELPKSSTPQSVPSNIYTDAIQTEKTSSLETSSTIVTGLRFWSNPNYTRIVIDADKETSYEHRLLKKDPAIQKPRRLFVDLNNSILGKDIEKFIPIRDNLLSDVRAGQNTPASVRVVVDIKASDRYKIFSLKNPFRIVIDVWVSTEKATHAKKQTAAVKKGQQLGTSALAKQLALGVRRIVIDPGHGGRDYGAPGYYKGVHEKKVILQIGKRLAQKIQAELKCEVILTRSRDKFLTLEERTAIANTQNADLFISLHANSSRDRRAYGIETYFLNLATDNEAILVAARENATSTKNISDLQTILNDLMQNAKINESSRLAAHVQESMYKYMKKKYKSIKNKGVKQAPFYVLLGAQMPAILIETSFISNKRECNRLISPKYQDHLCEAIIIGVRNYINETNPTAFFKEDSNS